MEKRKMSSGMIAACGLSLYLLHSMSSGINPALSTLTEAYPNEPLTTVTMISTIVMLTSVPGNLLSGLIVGKLGFKRTLYLGYALALFGGLLPFFVDCEIGVLILCRGLVGFAWGLFMPMGATYITNFFDGKERTRLIGWGSGVAGFSGIVVLMLGGILVSISLRHVFLYHLIVLIPMLATIIMPSPAKQSRQGESTVNFKLSGKTWIFCGLQGVIMLVLYPMMVYITNLVTAEGFGTITQATSAMTALSVAAFIAGFVYGPVRKLCGDRIEAILCVGMAAAMALIAFGHNMPMMFAGNIIAGFCYMTYVPYCTEGISQTTKPNQLTTAIGVGFAFASVAPTISVYMYSFLSNLFGRSNDIRFYFMCGAVLFVIMAVILFVRPNRIAVLEEKEKA